MAVLAADQLTKALAVRLVDDRTVVWGPVSFAVGRNTGGPFGLATSFSPGWLLVAAVGAVVTLRVMARVDRLDGVHLAAAVVAGGVFGNLVDRVARGRTGGVAGVVDWIRVGPYPFAFNLADVALRLGAVALALAVLWGQNHDAPPVGTGSEPADKSASIRPGGLRLRRRSR